jgi:ABC-type sugar transport system substrate-binding protein
MYDSSSRRTRKWRLGLTGGLATAVLALTAAACSSANTTTTDSSAGAGTAKSASTAASSSCVTSAKAGLAAAMAAPATPSVPKINVKSLAGKQIWLIEPDQTSFTGAVANDFTAAAEVAGLKPKVFDANFSTATENQDLSLAAADKPAAVVLAYIATPLVTKSLQAVTAAGVPVVSLLADGSQVPLDDGLYARVDVNATREGKLLADWMLVNSGCSASSQIIDVPVFAFNHTMLLEEQSEIKKLCGSNCPVYYSQVNAATMASDIQSVTASQMTAHPDIKYILPAFDVAAPYVQAGLSQTVKTAGIVSPTGNTSNLVEIKNHGAQVADLAWAPASFIAWAALNKAMDGMLNVPGTLYSLPDRLVDRTNIGDGNVDSLFPAQASYQQYFKTQWGLSS